MLTAASPRKQQVESCKAAVILCHTHHTPCYVRVKIQLKHNPCTDHQYTQLKLQVVYTIPVWLQCPHLTYPQTWQSRSYDTALSPGPSSGADPTVSRSSRKVVSARLREHLLVSCRKTPAITPNSTLWDHQYTSHEKNQLPNVDTMTISRHKWCTVKLYRSTTFNSRDYCFLTLLNQPILWI